MPFPTSNLDFELEIATGDLDLGPNRWTWTDVTDRVDGGQTLRVRRGRSDENASPQPASLGLVLANLDGELTPADPRSSLWPNLKKGTPIRYSVGGAGQALFCRGGIGEHCLAPHSDTFDMTADFDVRIRLAPDMWSHASPYSTIPLVGVWGDEGDRSWMLNLAGPGRLNLFHSTDGIGRFTATTFQVVAALRPEWIGCTYEPDTGEGSARRITYYRTDAVTPDEDVTTWDLVQSIELGTPRFVWADGAGQLRIGHYDDTDANTLRGRVHKVELRDGINGTLVADPDFTASEPGDPSVTDSFGNVFTVGASAELSTKATYYVGSIDDMAPKWPHGDNHRDNPAKPSEALVSWSTAGPLRRLQTGKKPIKSSFFRLATNSRWTQYLATYLPCEEQPGADRFASPFPDQPAATVTGIDVGSNTTLPASGQLPTIQSGKTGAWRALVNAGPSGTWNYSMLFLMPAQPDSPDWTQVFYVETQGTIRRWSVELNNGGRRLTGYDAAGNIVEQSTGALTVLDFNDWHVIRLEVETVGGAINWNVRFISIASGGGLDFNGTVIGSSGRVTAVGNETVGPAEGLAFGHVTIDDGTPPVSWTAGADTAWVGETAAHRFYRLCSEHGIEAEVIGDPTVAIGDIRGTEGLTYMMGPQRQLPLVDLLIECAALDQGIIFERRGGPGLVVRTRRTLEAQDPVVVLDALAEEIRSPFEPRFDDKDLVNDVTVEAVAGSSARALDQTSITESGLYDVARSVNSVGGVEIQPAIIGAQLGLQEEIDNQNEDLAAWFLHIGTWPGMRYPTVATDLALSPRMPAVWHTVRLGDRVKVANLPAQHPVSDVDLIVQEISDPFQSTQWRPSITCSPGGPWTLPRLSAGQDPTEPARLAADEPPVLTAGVDAVATELPLGTTDWTDDPDDYPLEVVVGGEVIEAAGVNSDGNYTLTGCVRSVNGVERAHPAGTAVQVAAGYRLALGPGDFRADPSDDNDEL